jgi:hypothetical protein
MFIKDFHDIRTNKTMRKNYVKNYTYTTKSPCNGYCDYCCNRHCPDSSFISGKSLKKQKNHKKENIKYFNELISEAVKNYS